MHAYTHRIKGQAVATCGKAYTQASSSLLGRVDANAKSVRIFMGTTFCGDSIQSDVCNASSDVADIGTTIWNGIACQCICQVSRMPETMPKSNAKRRVPFYFDRFALRPCNNARKCIEPFTLHHARKHSMRMHAWHAHRACTHATI